MSVDSYTVRITPEAEADLDEIWEYIAYELESGESAFRIVDELYGEIAKLSEMPKRFRIINREPWKSREVRFMFVENYRVHYAIDEARKTVTVFRVMYYRTDA